MSNRTAIVTGAAGFIGSHLTDRLLADGWKVFGVDSFEDFYPREYKLRNLAGAMDSPGFELVESGLLDLADASSEARSRMRSCLDEASVVYHLAAQAGVRTSWGGEFRTYTEDNVLATQLLLDMARDAGLDRFVYASTSSVYGDAVELPNREDARCLPYSPYGVTKLAGENLCHLYQRNFGVPTVALRLFTVYGPRQRPDMGFHRFIRMILEGRPIPVFGDGEQTRDFTYVSDIVDAFVAAQQGKPGGVYNVGGGSRLSLSEVFDILQDVMGRTAEFDVQARRPGDVQDTWASLERSRADLGYEPKVAIREGLAAEAQWLEALSTEPGYPWGAEL